MSVNNTARQIQARFRGYKARTSKRLKEIRSGDKSSLRSPEKRQKSPGKSQRSVQPRRKALKKGMRVSVALKHGDSVCGKIIEVFGYNRYWRYDESELTTDQNIGLFAAVLTDTDPARVIGTVPERLLTVLEGSGTVHSQGQSAQSREEGPAAERTEGRQAGMSGSTSNIVLSLIIKMVLDKTNQIQNSEMR